MLLTAGYPLFWDFWRLTLVIPCFVADSLTLFSCFGVRATWLLGVVIVIFFIGEFFYVSENFFFWGGESGCLKVYCIPFGKLSAGWVFLCCSFWPGFSSWSIPSFVPGCVFVFTFFCLRTSRQLPSFSSTSLISSTFYCLFKTILIGLSNWDCFPTSYWVRIETPSAGFLGCHTTFCWSTIYALGFVMNF